MINGSAINTGALSEGIAASDAGVIDITRTDDGWLYTLGLPPHGGWDIYDGRGGLIEAQYTEGTYEVYTDERDPPPLEAVSPTTGDSASMSGANYAAIQWQHIGATGYIVDRSADGTTWLRIGEVPADGSITHTFRGPTVAGEAYYRVYAAELDYAGWRKTSYQVPCTVHQMFAPEPPKIEASVSGGDIVFGEITDFADQTPITQGEPADSDSGSGGTYSLPIGEGGL